MMRRYICSLALTLCVTGSSAQSVVFDQPWSNCGGCCQGSDIPGCVHTATLISLTSPVSGDTAVFWGTPTAGPDAFTSFAEGAIEAFVIELREQDDMTGAPSDLIDSIVLPVGNVSAVLDNDGTGATIWKYTAPLSSPLTIPGDQPVFLTVAARFDHQTNGAWGWGYSCSGAQTSYQFLSCCCGDPAWFDFLAIGFSFRLVQSPPPCNAADLAEPFGELNFSDVVAFLAAFAAMDPSADLADPFEEFNFSDVVAFLAAFGAGCP